MLQLLTLASVVAGYTAKRGENLKKENEEEEEEVEPRSGQPPPSGTVFFGGEIPKRAQALTRRQKKAERKR